MKPILIGLALLILNTCLSGVVYQWNETGFQYLMAPGSGGGEGDDKASRESEEGNGRWSSSLLHQVEVSFDKTLSAFFQTDMNWEDRNPKNLMTSASVPASFYKNWRVSGTYNRFQAKLEYNLEKNYTKVQYRNQYFAAGRTNTNYVFIKSNPNLPFEPFPNENLAHRPLFIHDYYIQDKWTSKIAAIDIGGRIRISNYYLQRWVSNDTLSWINEDNTTRNETFFNGSVKIATLPNFFILTNLYSKHDLRDDYYDFIHYGLGLAYERKFNFSNMLDASTQYDRMNSDAYASEKDHYVTSQLRYTHRMGTNLTAFVSVINRSVYIEDEHSMFLVSNVVRLQARYSLKKDINGDSYVIAGWKHSPENKTSLVFGEFNYPVSAKVYVNVTDKYSPSYLLDDHGVKGTCNENETGLGLNFYFTPWQMVYVSDLFSVIGKKGLNPTNQHLISFGTKLVF